MNYDSFRIFTFSGQAAAIAPCGKKIIRLVPALRFNGIDLDPYTTKRYELKINKNEKKTFIDYLGRSFVFLFCTSKSY